MNYKNIKYINYRCRKCGQTISEYVEEANSYFINSKMNSRGVLLNNKYQHPNCTIEPCEEVFCDTISISSEPIVSEEFIYRIKKDEE